MLTSTSRRTPSSLSTTSAKSGRLTTSSASFPTSPPTSPCLFWCVLPWSFSVSLIARMGFGAGELCRLRGRAAGPQRRCRGPAERESRTGRPDAQRRVVHEGRLWPQVPVQVLERAVPHPAGKPSLSGRTLVDILPLPRSEISCSDRSTTTLVKSPPQ